MPQPSIYYAVARARMQSRQLLSAQQIERLLTAPDPEQAARVLLEAGYITADQPDAEKASIDRQLAAYELVRRLSPEPAATMAFLLRNDVNNLKILFKSRVLGEEPEGLSPGGTLDTELLRHAVQEHGYTRLPALLQNAMEQLEQRAAQVLDPMEVDVLLDQALYGMMSGAIANSRAASLKRWMAARADFANLRAYLRLKDMEAALQLPQVLVPGGRVPAPLFSRARSAPEKLMTPIAHHYGRALAQMAKQALEDRGAIGAVEKHMDEQLSRMFLKNRMAPNDLDALLHYLLSVEKESAAVRLIMAGKRNGMSREQIGQRLRSGYGR